MTKDDGSFPDQLADLIPGAEADDDPIITTGRVPAEGADPMVDHPAHYNQHPAGIECIEVIAPMIYPVGTAIRYLWRAGLKPGAKDVQDVEKAIWNLNYYLEQLKNPVVIVDGASLTDGAEE